jgi:hypothetical protein
MTPAASTTTLVDARGQQVGDRVLVEQGVAPREEDGVDLGLAHEPRRHRGLVHAHADRADDTLLAEPVQLG